MELSIIIVNWRSKDYLRNCLASIFATTRGLRFEVVVIDSASFDGCAEMLAAEFPAVRFLQSQENLGFARSNNAAFASSRGELVLFLNPDTEVVGSALTEMVSSLGRLPDAGAVGCRLLNSDGSLQTSCIQAFPTLLNQLFNAEVLRQLTPRSRLWGTRALFDDSPAPAPVEMISGACLMMRRRVFEEIGCFSTEYFMYAEDVDLCYKARQRGYVNYYLAGPMVVHHGGGSSQQARSNFSNVMMARSVAQFLRKFQGAGYSLCYRVVQGVAAVVRLLVLVVFSPVLLVKSGGARWRASCSKWVAIFNWALGLSRWPGRGGGGSPDGSSVTG